MPNDGDNGPSELSRYDRRELMKLAGLTGVSTVGAARLGTRRAKAQSAGEKLWSYETGGAVWASPTVVDGTVYVGVDSYDGNVYALDASDGTEQWSYGTRAMISSPTVVDGTVYVGVNNFYGNVYALDASDGSKKWSYETGARVASSPTVVDGTVYVGSNDNNLYALDASDGSKEWSYETGDDVFSSPTVVDGTVYVGSRDGNVYALDTSGGTEQWSYETAYPYVESSPTAVDGTVYVASDKLYALDGSDGTEQWSYKTDDAVQSSPTVADGTVYILNHKLHALDASDGSVEWSYEMHGRSSPTIADGTVYVGSDDSVYALDAETGTKKWNYITGDLIRSSPTVVDGVLYIGSRDGNVYALATDHSKSSEGSRVNLGTLGHHHVWAEEASSGGGDEPTEADIGLRNITTASGNLSFIPRETINFQLDYTTDEDEREISFADYQEITWDYGDGETETIDWGDGASTPDHTYDELGEYEVTVTVIGSTGVDQYQQTITKTIEIQLSEELESVLNDLANASKRNIINSTQLYSDIYARAYNDIVDTSILPSTFGEAYPFSVKLIKQSPALPGSLAIEYIKGKGRDKLIDSFKRAEVNRAEILAEAQDEVAAPVGWLTEFNLPDAGLNNPGSTGQVNAQLRSEETVEAIIEDTKDNYSIDGSGEVSEDAGNGFDTQNPGGDDTRRWDGQGSGVSTNKGDLFSVCGKSSE
jgi:outer membrane protein assembly factor BamB